MGGHPFHANAYRTAILLLAACLWWAPSEAGVSVRMSPSGDALELESRGEDGLSKTTIPVHRSGEIRYFSAGVGKDEREADYPPFSLKLVFVAGGRPFLSRVAVTIADRKGREVLAVPKEQVAGPWLFVDLPPGTYRVSAARDGRTQTQARVVVKQGGTATTYLRWKEEGGH